jgi:hypothetical protein
MNLKNLALSYFNAFSNKDIGTLSSMFNSQVTLRDWEVSEAGITFVVKANKQIFESVDTIRATPLALYQDDNTVVAELDILVNGTETVKVVDVITFNDSGEIVSIRAYKG